MNILSMLMAGVIAYLFLLVIEFGVFKWTISYTKRNILKISKVPSKDNDPDNVDDEDIVAQEELINHMTDEDLRSRSIVMKNLSKFYGKFCAVNQVSLSIKRYYISSHTSMNRPCFYKI